jgi:membrane protease YdiL (CAAX protease family)
MDSEFTKKKGIAVYLLMTFAGAWGLWLIGWIISARVLLISPSHPAFQFVLLPGAFMPAIAAIIVRKWITHEGFSDAGLRLGFKKNWKYYVFAGYLLPMVVVGSILGLAVLLHISRPDFTLQRSFSALLPQLKLPSLRVTPAFWALLLLQQMIIGVPVGTLVTWGEEFGWRSYLQIRLFADRPALAAVLTGLIWGLWHYPVIFLGYEHYENIGVGLLVFPLSTIMLSIIFGWLRIRTGSVWASSIAHGGTNSFGASMLLLLFVGGPAFTFVSYLGILSWIPLGAVCAWILLTGQLHPATALSPRTNPENK